VSWTRKEWEAHGSPCSAQCIAAAGPGCECSCGGSNHRGRWSHARARSKARRQARREAGGGHRALDPHELMGGGLVAPARRRRRDAGADDYALAVQAWADKLEASGHGDDVPAARQASFWRSAVTGRGWAAQERSARGQRRGGSRPLVDWMNANPRPRRADYRGERGAGDDGGRDWTPEDQRAFDAAGW
jgi:hypothetical protein